MDLRFREFVSILNTAAKQHTREMNARGFSGRAYIKYKN